MQQMKPYTRGETLPVPFPEQQRGPVAERNGHNGYSNTNGFNGWANPTTPGAQPPPTAALPAPPTYFQVLFQQICKRWKLLAVWLAITVAAAAYAVSNYGKPLWKAEGTFYYSPNYSVGGSKRLYTPPNIQTVLRIIRSPEILEKVRKEKNLPASVEAMQAKLAVNVVSQSDLISIAFEWPNKEQAHEVAQRIMELAIEQFENLRRKLSSQAIADLDDTLKKTLEDERMMHLRLNDMLSKKNIFDLRVEKDNAGGEASRLRSEIETAKSEKTRLEQNILALERRIKEELAKAESGKGDSAPSESQLLLDSRKREILRSMIARQREIDRAKIELKRLEESRPNVKRLYEQRQETREVWLKLEADIATQRAIIAGSKEIEEMEAEAKDIDRRTLEAKKGAGSKLVAQMEIDKQTAAIMLELIPGKIADLENAWEERRKYQRYLVTVEKEVLPIQQDIDALALARGRMTEQKQDHQKLGTNKLDELTIYSPATAGGAPSSTNYAKLGLGVLGLSLLLFVGFIAYHDMPGLMPKAGATAQPPVAPASLPHSQLPVPVWQHFPRTDQPPPTRGPGMSNEHLRALAERIAEGAPQPGSVILFTPTKAKLRVEALLGDLACFCLNSGGKVLVFEARTDAESPMYPAWTGPSARKVADNLENYLEGQSDRAEPCFAETLLTSVDYARGDLSRQLASVMAMYRFRQLLHDIKDRYALVLMIAPERCTASDIDVFSTLAEGIVVVINQDADPAEVEDYLRELRASDTPVFGAVTVPPAGKS